MRHDAGAVVVLRRSISCSRQMSQSGGQLLVIMGSECEQCRERRGGGREEQRVRSQ
jgi:hypothetical protein